MTWNNGIASAALATVLSSGGIGTARAQIADAGDTIVVTGASFEETLPQELARDRFGIWSSCRCLRW